MRNISINQLDDTPRTVVAIGTDYSHGHLLPFHTHRRAQLLYGATGVMQVSTQNGNWVVRRSARCGFRRVWPMRC